MASAHDDQPEQYAALFQPAALGTVTSRNRVWCLAHGSGFVEDGVPTERYAGYLGRIAAGSAGVVVLGGATVHETGWDHRGKVRLFDPKVQEGLGGIATAVHEHGSRFICQLGHMGPEMRSWRPGIPAWGPVQAVSPFTAHVPRAMTKADIADLRDHYLLSARHSLAAGADGVEIHAAQGYLLHQYLSAASNTRSDEYGGDFDGRVRLLLEVLDEIRTFTAAGVVGLRLSAGEPRLHGLTWPDVRRVAQTCVSLRLVDYITLSVPGLHGQYVKDGSYAPGALRTRTRELKSVSDKLRVVISQRVVTPDVADDIVKSGDADFVGMARALIADAEWGEKARSGRESLIRPCIACLEDCRTGTAHGSIGCNVNPYFGEDREQAPLPHRRGRERGRGPLVVVVGGGPAGCQASLAATRSGATVVLLERGPQLGGRVRIAGATGTRRGWLAYADYLEASIRRLEMIQVRRNCAANADVIASLGADYLIVATGAVPRVPLRWNSGVLVHSDDVLSGRTVIPGPEVVVYDPTGNWDGVSVIEWLSDGDYDISYVTPYERVAERVPSESRGDLLRRLGDRSVRSYLRSTIDLSDGALRIRSLGERTLSAPIDAAVVWSGESVSSPAILGDGAGALDFPAVVIGDALAPRGLSLACREGLRAGRDAAQWVSAKTA